MPPIDSAAPAAYSAGALRSRRSAEPAGPGPGSPAEVLRAFLRLGVTSFGGPIAHLGYFREEFVARRRWLDDASFADLVALSQFLPGPASSQVGFAVGLGRAGWFGGLAAWAGFTLPSALLLFLFARGASLLGSPWAAGLLHGLKLVAVAIVAQAVWGMARNLCPDRQRAGIALVAAWIVTAGFTSARQILAISLGGAAGLVLCRVAVGDAPGTIPVRVSRVAAAFCLALFAVLLVLLQVGARTWPGSPLALLDAFYRSGALVFGGGHVVLPLLRGAVVLPGWVSDDAFLAGYGAAQAVPGPLFTFAAYLGAVAAPSPGLSGAALALVGIFLPGMLLLAGALPFWDAFRRKAWAQAAMRGVNAAVVGLLGTALYDPVFTTAVRRPADFGIALGCFVLLVSWRLPPLAVVALGAAAGALLPALGGPAG
ncbi:MAG TPA: chromate efflux transporter [Anaeromyxobacteraceae bacterium]|nr:chromate efflux transporter [Anaeromyxobacteraceae bacterium]